VGIADSCRNPANQPKKVINLDGYDDKVKLKFRWGTGGGQALFF
jgi:hypothetical protein